jgi:hypothetical protein
MHTPRRGRALIVTAALLIAVAGAANAAPPEKFAKPGLITSIGQSSDIAVVKVLLNTKLKLGLEVDPKVEAARLGDLETLIIVVGASTKGLGAAGIDFDKEKERARELVKTAHDRGIRILAMHTGGESRRGKTTDDLLSLVIPGADYVIVVASGNPDGLFQRLVERRGTEIAEVESLVAAGDAVRAVFQE